MASLPGRSSGRRGGKTLEATNGSVQAEKKDAVVAKPGPERDLGWVPTVRPFKEVLADKEAELLQERESRCREKAAEEWPEEHWWEHTGEAWEESWWHEDTTAVDVPEPSAWTREYFSEEQLEEASAARVASDSRDTSPARWFAQQTLDELRPFPRLEELRSQVDQALLRVDTQPSSWEVTHASDRLSLELRWALAELEDGEVDQAWREEVGFWRKEVGRLEDQLDEQRRQGGEAVETPAEVTKATKAEKELRDQLRAEALAVSRAERQLAELERKKVRCAAAADEVDRRNATLRQSIQQDAELGEGGGTAHLFVAALPALDAAAVEFVQTALDAHMQKLALRPSKSTDRHPP